MSNVGRRVLRGSVLALVIVGFAPAASAVGQAASGDDEESSRNTVSAATLAAVGETAAPRAIEDWVNESIKAHEQAKEARRLAAELEASAGKLPAGSYVWHPERAEKGPVEIVVSLAAQKAWIFRDRKLIGITTVSTGRKGNETPTGRFPILQKKKIHFSNLYDDAPMPNMQRMTWDGVALHAGRIPGVPASHGCVRLPAAFSQLLYGVTRIDDVVYVIDGNPGSAFAALDEASRTAGKSLIEQASRVGARAVPRGGGSRQVRAR
jgi:lipoprotein-anchoring transpeptidase ErfK/SrfK